MNNMNKKEEETIGSFYMGRMRPPPPPPERKMPRGLLTVIALVAFAAIIWYAYPVGQEKYEGADVPVIKADTAAYKFKPEDPGGMEVRHQDSTVFDPLEKKTAEVEKLIPTTEEPLDKKAAMIETDAPKLNLDTQMQKVSEGTEKIVFPAAKEEAAKPEAEPAKKPMTEKEAIKVAADEAKKKPEKVAEKKETPAKETAKSSASGGTIYVRLGSYRNRAGASQDWDMLKKKYPQYLGGLETRVVPVDLGAKGTFNRLEAGKVTEVRAKEICSALAKTAGGCIVVK